MGSKDNYTPWTVRDISRIVRPGINLDHFYPVQLFVVLASETSVFIQLQCANAAAYDAIVLAVTSHCANAAVVLSQTRETSPLDIITLIGSDRSFYISDCVVFWFPVLHRSSQRIIRRLDGGRRFTG